MSQSAETASGEEPAGPITDSVFDFLYHDARRVASFLSQLDPSGSLTSLKQIDAAEKSVNNKVGASASGGVPALIRGGASMEGQSVATARETLERTYDPIWTNAIALLDMLDERGMIRANLDAARIGQFVKVSGSLTVTDLSLWKGLWALPVVQRAIAGGVPQPTVAVPQPSPNMQSRQGRKEARQITGEAIATSASPVLPPEIEAGLALLGIMPHTIQARLQPDTGGDVWCSLREEGLVVSAPDLTLKHGVSVPGIWTMVGVLDAEPEKDAAGEPTPAGIAELLKLAVTGTASISGAIMGLSPVLRLLLGRPPQAYGMTPLVIFRNVAA